MTRTTMAWLLLLPHNGTVMARRLTSRRSVESADDIPGKEVLMLTVEYPPGGSDPVHRHDAHGFIYVLEGSVVMQVQGGTAVTLTPG